MHNNVFILHSDGEDANTELIWSELDWTEYRWGEFFPTRVYALMIFIPERHGQVINLSTGEL